MGVFPSGHPPGLKVLSEPSRTGFTRRKAEEQKWGVDLARSGYFLIPQILLGQLGDLTDSIPPDPRSQEYRVFPGSQSQPQSQLLRVPGFLLPAPSPSPPPPPPPPLTKPTVSDLLEGRQPSTACFEIDFFPNLFPAPQRCGKREGQKQDIVCTYRHKRIHAHFPDGNGRTLSSVPRRKPTRHEEVGGETDRGPEAQATTPTSRSAPTPYGVEQLLWHVCWRVKGSAHHSGTVDHSLSPSCLRTRKQPQHRNREPRFSLEKSFY